MTRTELIDMTKAELIEENESLRFMIKSMMGMLKAVVDPMQKMVDETIGDGDE